MGDSGEIADFAMLLEYVHEIPGIERIRYTTSHPKEMTQRMMDAYARLPAVLPAPAGAGRQRPRAGRHEARLHHAGVRPCAACRPAEPDAVVRLHRRLPRRDRGRLRKDHEADRGRGLRHVLLLRLAPSRHAGGRPERRHAAGRRAPAAAPAGADQRAGRRHRPRHDRHAPAPAGGRPVAARSQRAHGPHREQPHRQLRRTRAAHRPDGRRHHHRRAHLRARVADVDRDAQGTE